MDRCCNSGEKSQKKYRQKRRSHRRERVRRKKIKVHEKVDKSRKALIFHRRVAPEGRRV